VTVGTGAGSGAGLGVWSMSVQSDRGARHERRTAKALGLARVGNSGRATVDAAGRWLVVECKSRRRLPAWLLEGMGQAERGAGATQLPVCVVHQVGARSAGDLVVMTRSAFAEWFGALHPEGEPDQVDAA
jgi:hypothetical protein